MQVLIGNTFNDFFVKNFGKYHVDISGFCEKIKNVYFGNTIRLKRPLMKLKFIYQGVGYRLVVLIKEDKIIPIIVFLKKDKKYGTNLKLDKETEKILDFYANKISNDIELGKIEIY